MRDLPKRGRVKCSIEGCEKKFHSLGFCGMHHSRFIGKTNKPLNAPSASRGTPKGAIWPSNRGENHKKYNFGFCYVRSKQRWVVVCKDKTVKYFARIVMENHIGRSLRTEEIVHHIDENPSNDHIDNLMIVTAAQHRNIHRKPFTMETRRKMSITKRLNYKTRIKNESQSTSICS